MKMIDQWMVKWFGAWMRRLKNADPARKIAVHRGMAEELRGGFVYLQQQMNIHPDSPRHKKEFVDLSGGFFPGEDKKGRNLKEFYSWDTTRRDMLLLLLREVEERKVDGAIAELGVYRGESARLFHHYAPERDLYLFDTFEGFDATEAAMDRKSGQAVPEKLFADTSEEQVRQYVNPQSEKVKLFAGRFPDTVTDEVRGIRYALVHLDADLYEPIKAGLEFFYARLSKGGVIIVHDYNAWKGARKAVEEFLQTVPERGVPMPDQSGSFVLIKTVAS